MNSSIVFTLNHFLYIIMIAGTLLMINGVVKNEKRFIKRGIINLMGTYLCLNLLSWVSIGTLNKNIITLANRFGVSSIMFFVDVLVGMILAALFFYYVIPSKQRKSPNLSIVNKEVKEVK